MTAARTAAPGAVHPAPDRCPGAVRLHAAADGLLARVRLPGGAVSAPQLRVLADLASELGDGRLELTSRANVQLRALPAGAGAELAARLTGAGLLPSLEHERVRNVVASPLSGLDGLGRTDVSQVAQAVDAAICAAPRLAALPGRFLVAVDDGRGDLDAIDADVRVRAVDAARAAIEPGGDVIALADVAAAVVALATAFLDELLDAGTVTNTGAVTGSGTGAWRFADLPDGAARVAARAQLSRPSRLRESSASPRRATLPQTVTVVDAPLGRLTAAQARTLAGLAGARGLRVTPWRSVVIVDVADPAAARRTAESAGLGVDGSAPWAGVTACAGRPGCAHALADVQADALATAARSPVPVLAAAPVPGRGRGRVHWSGCARRCGRPADTAVDVLAVPDGYVITTVAGDTTAASGDVAAFARAIDGAR